MAKTRRSGTRRVKRTRRRFPRRKHRGGNNYLSNDTYPSQTKGYPSMTNWALPDPKSTPNVIKH